MNKRKRGYYATSAQAKDSEDRSHLRPRKPRRATGDGLVVKGKSRLTMWFDDDGISRSVVLVHEGREVYRSPELVYPTNSEEKDWDAYWIAWRLLCKDCLARARIYE